MQRRAVSGHGRADGRPGCYYEHRAALLGHGAVVGHIAAAVEPLPLGGRPLAKIGRGH